MQPDSTKERKNEVLSLFFVNEQRERTESIFPPLK